MYRLRVCLAWFISHCYTCVKTWVESSILSSSILKKTRHPARIWRICCWIHIRAWIYRCCIVIHRSLVLDGSLHYVQCVTYAAILPIFILLNMIWYDWIQSSAMFKQQNVRWYAFQWSIMIWYQLTMFEVCIFTGLSRLLDTHIAYEIAI